MISFFDLKIGLKYLFKNASLKSFCLFSPSIGCGPGLASHPELNEHLSLNSFQFQTPLIENLFQFSKLKLFWAFKRCNLVPINCVDVCKILGCFFSHFELSRLSMNHFKSYFAPLKNE